MWRERERELWCVLISYAFFAKVWVGKDMEVYDEVCESNGDLCCEYEGSDNMKKISEHVENWENV